MAAANLSTYTFEAIRANLEQMFPTGGVAANGAFDDSVLKTLYENQKFAIETKNADELARCKTFNAYWAIGDCGAGTIDTTPPTDCDIVAPGVEQQFDSGAYTMNMNFDITGFKFTNGLCPTGIMSKEAWIARGIGNAARQAKKEMLKQIAASFVANAFDMSSLGDVLPIGTSPAVGDPWIITKSELDDSNNLAEIITTIGQYFNMTDPLMIDTNVFAVPKLQAASRTGGTGCCNTDLLLSHYNYAGDLKEWTTEAGVDTLYILDSGAYGYFNNPFYSPTEEKPAGGGTYLAGEGINGELFASAVPIPGIMWNNNGTLTQAYLDMYRKVICTDKRGTYDEYYHFQHSGGFLINQAQCAGNGGSNIVAIDRA